MPFYHLSILQGTELSGLTGVSFESSHKAVTEKLLRFIELAKKTEGSRMVRHTYISESLSVTEYSNGAAVYVNFGEGSVTLSDGTVLAGESFAVETGKAERR